MLASYLPPGTAVELKDGRFEADLAAKGSVSAKGGIGASVLLSKVDLRDGGAKSLVWRGIASQDKGDASKIEGKLDDMVRKSIDKYPPKLK